jgi:nickel-type superoxide dismutase maturation protease
MNGVPEAVDESQGERSARHGRASPDGPIKMPGTPSTDGTAPGPERPAPRWRDRGRVLVHDASMRPALEPGDRLKVDRGAYRRRPPAPGEIVVLVDPELPSRWLVKRVAAVDPATGTVEVRGDAVDVARDSRRFGPVPLHSIIGRAYRLYYPPDRRRDL